LLFLLPLGGQQGLFQEATNLALPLKAKQPKGRYFLPPFFNRERVLKGSEGFPKREANTFNAIIEKEVRDINLI
jgi:hypothetical protein